jgi:hypothetical protein
MIAKPVAAMLAIPSHFHRSFGGQAIGNPSITANARARRRETREMPKAYAYVLEF